MKKLLFEPLKIGSVEFQNRVIMSPMCQYSAKDGLPNSWHETHYVSRAIGGVGGIIIEATAVEPKGRITPFDLGLWNDEQKAAFKKLVGLIKQSGCKVGLQLAHAGRKASRDVPWKGGEALKPDNGGWGIIAPSPCAFDDKSQTPKQMSREDIKNMIFSFKNSAKRCVESGFDFVEIHMAHGYLLHEFLSGISNKRSDEYGGSFENRCRFPLEVAKTVRETIPEDMPLFVRISATDWVDGGWDLNQSVKFAKMLKDIGVNFIDVSSGGLIADAVMPDDFGFQSGFSKEIKEKAEILTGSVGMIVNPYQAEHLLVTNQADMVLLGRALLYEPYWVLHAADILKCENGPTWQNQYLRATYLRR